MSNSLTSEQIREKYEGTSVTNKDALEGMEEYKKVLNSK